MNTFKCFLILALGLSFAACDTKKKLDNMASTTQKLGATTEGMGQDMKEVKASSNSLDTKTQLTLTSLRHSESARHITDNYNAAFYKSAPDAKLDGAAMFFMAMEFQAWYPEFENQEKRELLYLEAVELMISKTGELVSDDMEKGQYWTWLDYVPSNEFLTLSSLAAAMSKIDPLQEYRAKSLGFKAMSFYDVLKEGLAAKAEYLQGEQIPKYQQRILEHETTFKYILNLRQNYFQAMVISKLSKFEEAPWDRAWMLMFGWSVDLDTYEKAELAGINEYLWKSYETQDYLKSIGEPLRGNDAFGQAYAKGEFYMAPGHAPVRSKSLYRNGQLISLEETKQSSPKLMLLNLIKATFRDTPPQVRFNPRPQSAQ